VDAEICLDRPVDEINDLLFLAWCNNGCTKKKTGMAGSLAKFFTGTFLPAL
jgi:hypothetical protein